MAFVQEPKEFVEAMPKGMVIRRATLMPLADQPRRVSRILQRFGNRDFRGRQTESWLFVERTSGLNS